MTRATAGPWLAGLLLCLAMVTACTSSAPNESSGSELPDEVRQLPAQFYQAVAAEPGANFDLATLREITVDPLQSVVAGDLEQTGSTKSPQAFFRYRDVQVLGGGCTGQGDNRVCEVRVQRVYDPSDPQGTSQGGRTDTRVFRAKPVNGEWKLFDTQFEGQWLTDLSTGSPAPSPGS